MVVNCTPQPDKMGFSFTWSVALPEEVKAVLDRSFIYHTAAQWEDSEKRSRVFLYLEPRRYSEQYFLTETHTQSKK